MTIASANYLPYVKTLMQSVKETNPDYKRYFVLVDKCSLEEIADDDLFEIIESDSIGIDHFDDMSIRYDVMELNTAVKPFAIEWLFAHTGAGAVIYLDPDIRVYRKLTELEELLDAGASVVVTPHLTGPLEDGKSPNDYHMLQAGVFNLGFIAVNRKPEARQFVQWWSRRLVTQGHNDVTRNLFTDQRWVDLAPCFLADLSILRNPAYNVAYWNLIQRPVSARAGKYFFDGHELAFFHFSGIDREKATVVSKHQDRLTWKDIKPLHPLFNDYRRKMLANGWGMPAKSRYRYDYVGNLRISAMIRSLYREIHQAPLNGVRVDEHFLIAMCNEAAGLPVDRGERLTRLMYKVYRERRDLQAVFTLSTLEGIEQFISWFVSSAEREHNLDPRVARPRRAEPEHGSQAFSSSAARFRPNADKPWYYRHWRKARKWVLERI